ncbi:MAG: hypothetical protein Q7K42_06055 [Candidatus Diapherotrites archaeon]|nr:hypothetical protein [Candidatus Diapherotrites archaeon]
MQKPEQLLQDLKKDFNSTKQVSFINSWVELNNSNPGKAKILMKEFTLLLNKSIGTEFKKEISVTEKIRSQLKISKSKKKSKSKSKKKN